MLIRTGAVLVFTAFGLSAWLAAAADLPLGHKDFMPSPQRPVGWRGDGSGCFPGATPPTQWDAGGNGVLWRVTMPHQTLSSPVVVGNKVITLADPHTILCYETATGKRLWYNAQDHLDMVCGSPAEAKKIRRLWDLYHRHFTSLSGGAGGWNRGKDNSGMDLGPERTQAEQELKAAGVDITLQKEAADANPFFIKYGLWSDGHAGIGFANATPVSDGKFVWAVYGSHDVCCYNLADGKLVWLTFLGELSKIPNGYLFNSPVLVDGILVVQAASHLRGLDAATGNVLWDHPYPDEKYSCGTPLVIETGGRKLVVTWKQIVVEPRTGKVFNKPGRKGGFEGLFTWKMPDLPTINKWYAVDFGNSAFPGGPGQIVQQITKYGGMGACELSDSGGTLTARQLWAAQPSRRDDEDTGTSLCWDGYVYMNDGFDLIEMATGKLIPRELECTAGGYPGNNVAGTYYFNFDGAASCGVMTLGPGGAVVANNHLLPGYKHGRPIFSGKAPNTNGLSQGKGGNRVMGEPKQYNAAWWKHVHEQHEAGVIGWVGRHYNIALGEMTADPFFHGERIYVRTYTELICIGGK